MQNQVLEKIDFFSVLAQAADFAASKSGADFLLAERPETEPQKVAEKKAVVFDCQNALRLGKSSVGNFPQISEFLSVLKTAGKVLDIEAACNFSDFCEKSDELRKSFAADSDDFPNLRKKVLEIPDFSAVRKIFAQKIDLKSRQLRETAEMREKNEKIRKIKAEIDAIFRFFCNEEKFSSLLQSFVPVLRENRQVLAVKSSQKGQISGIVHGFSNSAQTAFLEPEKAVQKNNDLIQAECELEVLKAKILANLTDEIRAFADDFEAAEKKMSALDANFAKAKWGISRGAFAMPPTSQSDLREICLVKARHPVLDEKAVPIDIRLGQNVQALIVSGPNTGGKTVAIKTAALFAALNQCAFPLPADESSCLPVFDAIFADIGDAQSLEMSLSTFSSRMKNIADAATNATARSLVLLDELASGTDPQEGGALAMAVLKFLIEKGATVLATTHHGAVKNFAYENPLCENSCAEFDEKSLAPTFRIVSGAAGESRAIEIAESQKLPRTIIDNAKSFLTSERADVSALIRGLNEKNRILSEKIDDFDQKSAELAAKTAKLAEKELKLAQKSLEINQKMQKSDSEFLKNARRELENLVRILREGEITREKTKKVRTFLDNSQANLEKNKEKLKEESENLEILSENLQNLHKFRKFNSKDELKIQKMNEKLQKLSKSAKNQVKIQKIPENFVPNAEVLLKNGLHGRLLKREKNGKWLVEAGSLKIRIAEKEMSLVASSMAAPQIIVEKTDSSQFEKNSLFAKAKIRADKPAFELFVVGMRQDEALQAVERQVDLAAVSGLSAFSIVHGKGEGILQRAIHEYLARRAEIESFGFAAPEFGGTGKTEVKMKI